MMTGEGGAVSLRRAMGRSAAAATSACRRNCLAPWRAGRGGNRQAPTSSRWRSTVQLTTMLVLLAGLFAGLLRFFPCGTTATAAMAATTSSNRSHANNNHHAHHHW